MFKCLECGRKFKTTRAAERAVRNGCPGCGGVDVDLDVNLPPERYDRKGYHRPAPPPTHKDGCIQPR